MAANPPASSAVRSAEELRARLQAVSQELSRTQRELQEDAAGLEKLRHMLDPGYWNELIGIVNQLDGRLRDALETAQEADALSSESQRRLEEEQRRLEKLWDAFKAQEDELRAALEKGSRLERELQDKDSSRARLEAELEEREAVLRRVESENDELRARVEDLEKRLEALRDMEALRAEAEDYRGRYEAERERLAKLYALYEESEAERERMKHEIELVDEWFKENTDALEKVSRSLRWRAQMLKRRPA